MSEPAFWPVALGLLGLVFGSFIATVAVPVARRSFGIGRPVRLRWMRTDAVGVELVPLIGWLVLRGRCETCGARIAFLHPVVELLGLGIGATAGLAEPNGVGVAGAVFGWLLLAAGAIDFAAFRLPNPLTLALATTGLMTGAAGLGPPLLDRMIGGVAGFAALWLVAAGYRSLRGRDGLGGGDAKLIGAIGLWLGWRALPPVLLIACVLGLIWALLRGMKRDDRLPLGTLLAVGGVSMWIAAHL